MTKALDRALTAARKAEEKAARILAHETLLANLRDTAQLVRARDYATAGQMIEGMRDACKALAAKAGE